ncbi:MAG: isochorismatase family protein, partial [Actinomycetota bacterium]|nr:isochorismatase family protein [Actinomycetota bacterium]
LRHLYVCGISTDHCCNTTARLAADLGYDVSFVLDATRTFNRIAPSGRTISADAVAEVTAASFAGEFGEVVTTEAAIQSIHLRSSVAEVH